MDHGLSSCGAGVGTDSLPTCDQGSLGWPGADAAELDVLLTGGRATELLAEAEADDGLAAVLKTAALAPEFHVPAAPQP